MSPILRLALAVAVVLAAAPVPPAHGDTAAADAFDALWLEPGAAFPVPRLHLEVSAPSEVRCGDPLRLHGVLRTEAAYPATVVRTRIVDADGAVLSAGDTTLDLVPGANDCVVTWATDGIPLGTYLIEVEADFATGAPRARYEIPFVRVNGADLAARLAETAAGHTALLERLTAYEEAAAAEPYARLRLRVAGEFIDRARADLDQGDWRALSRKLAYLEQTVPSIAAWLTFGGATPELHATGPAMAPGSVLMNAGGLEAAGRPVYLFGATVRGTDRQAPGHLSRFGLNFAVIDLPPAATMPRAEGPAPFEPAYGALFDALETAGITAVVTLSPQKVPGWLRGQLPDLTDKGFVDLTHGGFQAPLRRHFGAALPWLAGRDAVLGAVIAEDPHFRFDSEATRLAFVEAVRARFPDRQELNRTWGAHLGSYEEIGIWGNYPGYAHLGMDEDTEDWRYQTNSAYQFAWQGFHQAQARAFLRGLVDDARGHAGDLPLGITVSEQAFAPGQTREGLHREDVARMTAMGACAAASAPDDPFYAMRYPLPYALYALLRAYAPDSPVLNLRACLFAEDTAPAPDAGAYVHGVVWESVMAGLTGMALPEDSPVFDCPQALEAYATAALDVNRLAPVVRAFQHAPARVGVLFSISSAIFHNGDPHLQSALDAFEGASFSGYPVRFIPEDQCTPETLADISVVIIPETPALGDTAFEALAGYIKEGGVTVRLGTPIPYDDAGATRAAVLPTTARTVLVRGLNLPTEYLHAMDATIALGSLPATIRAVNAEGYPLEGVRTRCIEHEGDTWLYLQNLRPDPVICHLTGNAREGRDVVRGRALRFPLPVAPMEPMLIRLQQPGFQLEMTASR